MENESMYWPNFYIVGAAKAGTTSVYAYLIKHPQVFIPKIKEPGYFLSVRPNPDAASKLYVGDLEGYQRLYKGAKGYEAIGDASTGYIFDRHAARSIHEVCPQARIVVLLRDPVARSYSQYFMFQRFGMERLSFAEAIRRDHSEMIEKNSWGGYFHELYVELGLYYEQVRRYIEVFGRDQVEFFLHEDMANDTPGVIGAICRHIGVDPGLLSAEDLARIHNPGRVPRYEWLYNAARTVISFRLRDKVLPHRVKDWLGDSPWFYKRYKQQRDDESTRYLQSIYEPDICRLEELLGRKFPQLRQTWI
ncbi:MAG: sulfotransferase [Terracidiphilus sp.]